MTIPVPPVRVEISSPGPVLSLDTLYNLSCTATGSSPLVLYNWTISRPGQADTATVSPVRNIIKQRLCFPVWRTASVFSCLQFCQNIFLLFSISNQANQQEVIYHHHHHVHDGDDVFRLFPDETILKKFFITIRRFLFLFIAD